MHSIDVQSYRVPSGVSHTLLLLYHYYHLSPRVLSPSIFTNEKARYTLRNINNRNKTVYPTGLRMCALILTPKKRDAAMFFHGDM